MHIMQQSPQPDLNEIAAFIAVAEAGSFSSAGAKLARDPTVVGRRIQSLEARIGVRLIERTTRHVALTEAGRVYLAKVRPLVEALNEANSEVAEVAYGSPRGRLRLTLPASFGRMWLAPLVAEFLAAHPGITIDVEYSNRFVDLVAEGFDAAIRLGSLADSQLVAKRVADRRCILCASPSYLARAGTPVHPQDLVHHNCLIFTGKANPLQWEFIKPAGGQLAVPVRGNIECDDAEALVVAGVRGLGIVYANDWLVARELAAGTLLPVLADWRMADEGAIYVVVPSRAGMPAKTRAFCDFITSRLRGEQPWQRTLVTAAESIVPVR